MNLLDQIVETKLTEIRNMHSRFQLRHFIDSELFSRSTQSLCNALGQSSGLAVIAEIKKASPSAGVIRTDFNPVNLSKIYESHKADAISVLTDQKFFQGSIESLRAVAGVSHLPLLRKDFILDEYQVFEARANGADAILLIAEILSANQITELTHAAATINLEVLLELHSTNQLEKINFAKNRLIGINNRNLSDLSVNPDTAIRIKEHLPSEVMTVAESGLNNKSQIEKIKNSGIRAILVGEHLLHAANPAAALQELQQWCSYEN